MRIEIKGVTAEHGQRRAAAYKGQNRSEHLDLKSSAIYTEHRQAHRGFNRVRTILEMLDLRLVDKVSTSPKKM